VNKNYLLAFCIILPFCVCSCGNKQDDAFSGLSEIEGSWQMPSGDSAGVLMVEVWNKVNDTLYTGGSYEVTGNDSVLFETVQLVNRQDGIFYIPEVQNQNGGLPVHFMLSGNENKKFTFVNPGHDFPTSISYDFSKKDSLIASISGNVKGVMRSMEFRYGKTGK
jgi:hypothetical protein